MSHPLLRIVNHLSFEEIDIRYKTCKNARNKTRWHLIRLMAHPKTPCRVTEAARIVGYGERWARMLVGRYNAQGETALVDQRKNNVGQLPILSKQQQEKLKEVLLKEKPKDGGLWTGPKVAQWITKETNRTITPQGAWSWLRKISYSPQVPRPTHTKSATEEERDDFKKNSPKRLSRRNQVFQTRS